MAKKSRQQILKLTQGQCFFCGATDYEILDVHRITPAAEGGKYCNPANTLVACCQCHRHIHAGRIVVDKKYHWSGPGYMIHYWKDGEEFWEPELSV